MKNTLSMHHFTLPGRSHVRQGARFVEDNDVHVVRGPALVIVLRAPDGKNLALYSIKRDAIPLWIRDRFAKKWYLCRR